MSALVHLLAATPVPSPSLPAAPGIGDTVNLAGPWQWTLPLVLTLSLGVATAAGVVFTLWQKHRSDRRQQLWNRMQWILDAMLSEDPTRGTAGALAAKELLDSRNGTRRERPPAKMTDYDVALMEGALESLY